MLLRHGVDHLREVPGPGHRHLVAPGDPGGERRRLEARALRSARRRLGCALWRLPPLDAGLPGPVRLSWGGNGNGYLLPPAIAERLKEFARSCVLQSRREGKTVEPDIHVHVQAIDATDVQRAVSSPSFRKAIREAKRSAPDL